MSDARHPDYNDAQVPLKTVRDCIEGAWRVKQERTVYLKHPCGSGKTPADREIYAEYLEGAEFDGDTDQTRRSWLGKMRLSDTSAELPEKIAYLEQNADGDGRSLRASIEHSASELFAAKYHILVADYKGLSDLDIEQLSIADVRELAPRSTIKTYRREDLVNYDFKRINGVMRLYYVVLRECGSQLDPETGKHEPIESFLTLALDSNGHYYQQREFDGNKGAPNYVKVGGKPLTWLPVEIAADEELPVGALPRGMGMLYPIAESVLARYRVSADYKEAMRYIVPTVFTRKWQPGDAETFKEVNGRDGIIFGPRHPNNLPGEVEVEVVSSGATTEGFERYFKDNADKVQSMGGATRQKPDATRTATEADIDATEQNAMLETVADSLEDSYKRIISYCAMFEGIWKPEAVEDNLDKITIQLPRDFSSPKLSVEEVRELLSMIDMGVRTRAQVVHALDMGGWDYQDAQTTLEELELEAPTVSSMADSLAGDDAAEGEDVTER